jgi:hypothetical protein
MFTGEDREALRARLLETARSDRRIAGAAVTGSAARDGEDRWSDIDLMLGLAAADDLAAVMADWTGAMYGEHGAAHHLDVSRGATTYRVFLLASTLQVDIAFAVPGDFRATSPTFRLVFGQAGEPDFTAPPQPAGLIGLAWLYALHARSSLARGRLWQAEYMISGMREHVLALMCLRHGTNPHQGRGLDDLPDEALGSLTGALPGSVTAPELWRAFGVVSRALISETLLADADLAGRLAAPLRELASDPGPAG